MAKDWYSEFFSRITQELMEHLAGDMPQLLTPLLQGLPIESFMASPDVLKVLGQLGSMAGFTGFRIQHDAAYMTLGLNRTASDDEVKKRYRDLAKKLHPDVSGEETAHLFILVQAAYEQIAKERGWKNK